MNIEIRATQEYKDYYIKNLVRITFKLDGATVCESDIAKEIYDHPKFQNALSNALKYLVRL